MPEWIITVLIIAMVTHVISWLTRTVGQDEDASAHVQNVAMLFTASGGVIALVWLANTYG